MTNTLTRSALIGALLAMSLAAVLLLPAPASAATALVHTRASAPAASAPSAQAPDAGAAAASAPAADRDSADEDTATDQDDADWDSFGRRWGRLNHHHHLHRNGNDLVSVGRDATLAADETRDSVVAVFGSATNNGTANEDVVSVFGDTTVNGATQGDAVAVLGNVSVNAEVGSDVVAVLGSVTLGPKAHVHGQVVSILGTVTQDPSAVVDQGVQSMFPENFAAALGLRNWVTHAVFMARPLAIGAGLSWLWYISFGLLAIYALLALLFRDAAQHCITTLNDHPGKSLVTAILAVVLTPIMFLLLTITVVGILAIPIAVATLICAAIFGKTTVLGWIGSRCFGVRAGQPLPHPALCVIVGGLLVMIAYLVPFLGLVLFILLGMLGYGAVIYSIINRIRHHTAGGGAHPATPAGGAPSAAPAAPAAGPAGPAAFSAAPDAAAAGAAEASGAAAAAAASSGPGLSSSSATASPAALPLSTYPRAGFWIRMGALFIDAVIILACIKLLLNFPNDGSGRITLIALAVYGAIMWKVKGTTIGGIVCGLHVVRADSRPLDWPTVCVRAIGCILSICALGLGFIWIGLDAGKEGWHDKLAGTIVVRVPRGTPLV